MGLKYRGQDIGLRIGSSNVKEITSNGIYDVSNYGKVIVNLYGQLNDVLDKSITGDLTIKEGVEKIPPYLFQDCTSIKNIRLPNSITDIGEYAFDGCNSLSYINIPQNIAQIKDRTFRNTLLLTIDIPDGVISIGEEAFKSSKLKTVSIPNSVTKLSLACFSSCSFLTDVYIPKSITYLGAGIFSYCIELRNVILENGFNTTGLDLSHSKRYSRETITSWLNALADRTDQTPYRLTIGATNLEKLTSDDIAIATAKNWTLA